MKSRLIKVLFILLFCSTMVPVRIQASWSWPVNTAGKVIGGLWGLSKDHPLVAGGVIVITAAAIAFKYHKASKKQQKVNKLINKKQDREQLISKLKQEVELGNLKQVKELVALLKQQNIVIDSVLDADTGNTALLIAADKGYTKIVEFLIAEGAHINMQNKDGKTASMIAGDKSYVQIVRLLKQQEERQEHISAN